MKLGDPPNFPNLDEKWYYCYLCGGGHVADTSSSPMYPESMTILATEDGHRYCLDHYHWRFHHKYIDEVEIDITDDLE
jgi:hypothetical protein